MPKHKHIHQAVMCSVRSHPLYTHKLSKKLDKVMASPASVSTVDYDYKFLTEPDDALLCRICSKVAKDPKQHVEGDCGMLFCRECIENWGNDANCRMEHPNYVEDPRSKLHT